MNEAFGSVEGIIDSKIDFGNTKVTITFDDLKTNFEKLEEQ